MKLVRISAKVSRNFVCAVALISSIVASSAFSASSRSMRCVERNSKRCFSAWYSSKAAKLMLPSDLILSRSAWISSRSAAKSTNSSGIRLQLHREFELLLGARALMCSAFARRSCNCNSCSCVRRIESSCVRRWSLMDSSIRWICSRTSDGRFLLAALCARRHPRVPGGDSPGPGIFAP